MEDCLFPKPILILFIIFFGFFIYKFSELEGLLFWVKKKIKIL